MKQVKAFIFDLDGVITDTAEHHYLAWKALAEELGITFTREHNEELKGVSRMDSLEKILAIGGGQQEFSSDEKEKLAKQKNEHYVQLIQNISPEDILPGIKEFITKIKSDGLKLAIASASKNAVPVLEGLGLKEEFDIIVDAGTIKNGKPNPEIFLRAAELVHVTPSECIGIEDAIAGVDAIKSAEMFAVAIGPKESFAKADLVYETTDQLSYEEIITKFQETR
jgi:beta-phosphoglucomutase